MAEPKPAAYGAPAAQALVASTTDRVRPNAKLIALLSLGHFVVDLNQGSLPAFLPVLKAAHQLSYASAATIVLAANVAASLVQPLFGYFADQTARRWMLPASVLLTGVGFALMGLAPDYTALIALVVAMGLGVAAYHPEAYKAATSVAGERKATALSWFSLGGNVGVALGAGDHGPGGGARPRRKPRPAGADRRRGGAAARRAARAHADRGAPGQRRRRGARRQH